MVFETFLPNMKMTGALIDWSTRFSRTGEAVHLMTLAGAPELSGTGLDTALVTDWRCRIIRNCTCHWLEVHQNWSFTQLLEHLPCLLGIWRACEISVARKLGNCATLICAFNFRRYTLRHGSNLRRYCTGNWCVVNYRTSVSKSVLVLGCVSMCLGVSLNLRMCQNVCRYMTLSLEVPQGVRIYTDVSEFRTCAGLSFVGWNW